MERLGTDFGTSNSSTEIAKFVGSKDGALYYPIGNRTYGNFKPYPSFVKYRENGQVASTGWDAKNGAELAPQLTIFDMKRLIGRRYDEPEFQSYRQYLTYNIDQDDEGQIMVKIGSKKYYPEEIASDLMAAMVEDALIEHPTAIIDKWVVSVPANFDTSKRDKTKRAAMLAIDKLRSKIIEGECVYRDKLRFPDYKDKNQQITNPADVQEIKLISEPTAAMYTYLAKKPTEIPKDKFVLLFDLGAGTLDITIGTIYKAIDAFPDENNDKESNEILKIHKTYGNNDLGGRRMDENIQKWAENEFIKQGNPIEGPLKIALKSEVEQAKIRLTKKESTDIFLSSEGLRIGITRQDLEREIDPILSQIRKDIKKSLQLAGITKDQIAVVVLVGGPTQMPCIRKLVESETIPISDIPDWDPLLCVAEGAARIAAGEERGEKEPSGFSHYIAVEIFEGCIVPFTVIDANKNETLPKSNKIEILVRRNSVKGTNHNMIYLCTGSDTSYHCFNKFTIPVAPGKGDLRCEVEYPWKKIQYYNNQMKHKLPFDFGKISIDYYITDEGLWKAPTLTDPVVNKTVRFTDIPRGDMGTITPVPEQVFKKDIENYSRKVLEKMESDYERRINERMRGGLSRERAEYAILTEEVPPPPPFLVLREIVRIAIQIAEERKVGSEFINTWRTEYNNASTESEANTYALWGIESALEVALQMSFKELIEEVKRR